MSNELSLTGKDIIPAKDHGVSDTNIGAARITTEDGHVVEALGKTINFVNRADKMITEIHVNTLEEAKELAASIHPDPSAGIITAAGEPISSQTTLTPQQIQLFPAVTNCDYFNLIVVRDDDFTTGRTKLKDERVLTNPCFTDNFIRESHLPLTPDARKRLYSYPTVFCAEMIFTDGLYGGNPDPNQMAKLGFIKRVSAHANEVYIDYDVAKLQTFPQSILFEHLDDLDIERTTGITELSHTHWSIKYCDLTQLLRNYCPNLILPVSAHR